MDLVLLRIVLSFFIAGAWIAATTMLGERLGSRMAGLIGNMPSNILISLLFMALTKGPDYAAAATAGVPMGMTIDLFFLAVFIVLLPVGLWLAMAAALAAWVAIAALVLLVLPPFSFVLSVAAYAAVTILLFALVSARLGGKKAEKKPVRFSWGMALLRALFAGSIVAGAVTVAQVAPPYMTGVLATFPAVFTSTMVILTKSQGVDFAQVTGKLLLLSSCNIIVYSTSAGILFPLVGPWLGTLFSFAVAACSIVLIGRLSRG